MGAFNEAYTFLFQWLFGSEPVSAVLPFAEGITLFIALFFICAMMFFAFKLVTGLIRLVYYLFDK